MEPFKQTGPCHRKDGGAALLQETSKPAPLTLSIIIPVYNEAGTLPQILEKVSRVPLAKEIIIVDDGSTDGTRRVLDNYGKREGMVILRHPGNLGKRAAVRTGIGHATGAITLIQDGDLEYDPADYPGLIGPIARGEAAVVYGTRKGNAYAYFPYYLGGKFLSLIANLLYSQRLSDVYTCYKAFSTPLLKSLSLTSCGFEFEAEVTARVAGRGIRIREVPIRYYPRTIAQGKKIRWNDGVKGVWTLLKCRF